MALQVGLVGLPNVGKSTLFNALTQAGALVANYPFTTIDPNVGVAPVHDARLARIAEIVHPEKVTPTTLRVVDIAGLVKGASQGEGLGNQFLSHIRGVDAIVMVVRCFDDENVAHVTPYIDPLEDIDTVGLELLLSDLDLLERHLERVQAQAKTRPRDYQEQLGTIRMALQRLREGASLRHLALEPIQRAWLEEADLLTGKPLLYVANVSEKALPEGGSMAQAVRQRAQQEGAEAIVLCAATEAEIVTWDRTEALAYLQELGLEVPGLEQLVSAGYRLLDLVTFFTTTGGKEVRAWTLRRGQTAIEAAGQIHTDLARGFIRAEVVAFQDLDAAGSIAQARERGQYRLEGRDYVVQDGDVIHIRFNV
jgi:hypothetical protein